MKNVEIKAYYADHDRARAILMKSMDARFVGSDHQIDTYFKADKSGVRFKLRQGNIENALVSYARPDTSEAKVSDLRLYDKVQNPESLKTVLLHALDILGVVDKVREIYFHGNVKVHLDTVQGLGTFIEIEAQDRLGEKDLGFSVGELHSQCTWMMEKLLIRPYDLIQVSYSDMLLGQD